MMVLVHFLWHEQNRLRKNMQNRYLQTEFLGLFAKFHCSEKLMKLSKISSHLGCLSANTSVDFGGDIDIPEMVAGFQ